MSKKEPTPDEIVQRMELVAPSEVKPDLASLRSLARLAIRLAREKMARDRDAHTAQGGQQEPQDGTA